MIAQTIAHALGGRRSGRGYTARCPAHDDRSPSLSITDRDGTVLVHCHAGCDQAAVIDALRARGLWPERERPDWTPEDRKRWAEERRAIERDLPDAYYWRRGITTLIEQDLCAQKARLLDPTEGPADSALIASYTRILTWLQRAGDESLVQEFRAWRSQLSRECAGLVRWAREREQAEIRALVAYFAAQEEVSD